MRLQISRSKNAASLYIVKSTYDRNGKRSNTVVEKLGTMEELSKIHEDPIAWGEARAKELTLLEKAGQRRITLAFDTQAHIEKDNRHCFQCGYLFLQRIYYECQLDQICKLISKRYQFEYDLNDVLSRLVYGRILFPGSKLSTMEESRTLLEQPSFELHDIYRALDVLAKESEWIQRELYKRNLNQLRSNSNILYYDCTNYYFEIDEASGLKQYGLSKQHKPFPIVEMGLFMDGDGLPLAFCIHPGNTSEQKTMLPLEKQIITDFGKSKIVVCTDAGLASDEMKRFNSTLTRRFITVQSLKKLSKPLKKWVFDPTGWYVDYGGKKLKADLQELQENEALSEKYKHSVFYKEQWTKDATGFEQRYVVTFSLAYKKYLRIVREHQIEMAKKRMAENRQTKRPQDPKRFIKDIATTKDGELAEKRIAILDQDRIDDEEQYDGYYCVATNLEDDVHEIIRVNKRRWEIEESFRIMKTEFKARPVFLSRDDRITAHFLTCFLSLYIYRILEKKLNEEYTCEQIVDALRSMYLLEMPPEGYVPAYTRSEITDALHAAFGFYTDFEIMSMSCIRKILKISKNR